MSLAIDCAFAKVLISHTLPQFPHRFVFMSIAINPFSRFSISLFHAPNCSKSRHFGTKSVVLLAIDSPFRKSCFSVRFVHTYSLNSLPPQRGGAAREQGTGNREQRRDNHCFYYHSLRFQALTSDHFPLPVTGCPLPESVVVLLRVVHVAIHAWVANQSPELD